MTTKEHVLEQVESYLSKSKNHSSEKPIYEILLMSETGEEPKMYPNGVNSGFPDMGTTDTIGFYYDINDAIETMHTNNADIRECLFKAGFVLCRFPRVYQSVCDDLRIYFVWDDARQGFFETEEPELFQHLAL